MLYRYSRPLTIDHTKVPNTDQTNFPALFSGTYAYLATIANGGKVTNASGYDIIFTSDAAGTTKLDHEIETYTATTGAVNFWVRVPTVSHTTDTVIYLWYGNSAITTSQENVTGVWDANFKGVWHLPNGTTLTANDSTGVNNLTNNGTTPAIVGKVDGGASFNGSSQYLSRTSAPTTATDNYTMEAWINPAALNVLSLAFYNGNDAGGYGFGIGVGAAGSNLSGIHGSLIWIESNYTFPSTGTWYHIVFLRNAGTTRFYVNGVVQSGTSAGTPLTPNARATIGNQLDGSNLPTRYFNGSVDEARISSSARSADWITTEYNNQSSPSTFYTVGEETFYGSSIRTVNQAVMRAATR